MGTAFKCDETMVLLYDQESSLGIKVGIDKGNTLETGKAEVHSSRLSYL